MPPRREMTAERLAPLVQCCRELLADGDLSDGDRQALRQAFYEATGEAIPGALPIKTNPARRHPPMEKFMRDLSYLEYTLADLYDSGIMAGLQMDADGIHVWLHHIDAPAAEIKLPRARIYEAATWLIHTAMEKYPDSAFTKGRTGEPESATTTESLAAPKKPRKAKKK